MFFAQLCCLFCTAIAFLAIYCYLALPPKLEITACDVGQGDAILVSYGQSHILIDTGPNSAVLRCLQAKISPISPVLDLVVLSHPDKDHAGGWEEVSQHYVVQQLWTNGQQRNPKSGLVSTLQPSLGDLVKLPGIRLNVVWNSDVFDLWNKGVSPEEESNARSVGTYLQSRSFGFLSLGDLECQQELAVTTMSLLGRITILKTSHHGSKSSSCIEFLKKIRTETAIISVGEKNSYNHPEENVLRNLENAGASVYRTDFQGRITFWWDETRGLYVLPEY